MTNRGLAERKSVELKKHVNAIHCSNNLTLVQRKLFNALLFNAYPDMPYKQKFQIKSKDLCNLIGYNSKDTVKLKNALLGLIKIVIEWNVIDSVTGQEKQWKASSILASAEYSDGVCVYEYSQVMKDLLYRPEIYGRINLELITKFNSSYGLALYENCIRYQNLTQTPWFSLEIFKKLMGVLESKYSAFKDFKKRVIDVAVNEVNVISPIVITPEIERVNNKVTKIRFKLEKKSENKDLALQKPSLDNELELVLNEIFGLSQQMIEEIVTTYGHEYAREKIDIIMQSDNFITGKIRGLAGYFIEALKKDYKPSKSSKAVINDQRKIKHLAENEKKQKEENRAERYSIYVGKKIASYIEKLAKDQYEKLIIDFEIYLQTQNRIFQSWYKKHGLNNNAIKACFHNFIKETRVEQFGELLSFEDFINLIDENN